MNACMKRAVQIFQNCVPPDCSSLCPKDLPGLLPGHSGVIGRANELWSTSWLHCNDASGTPSKWHFAQTYKLQLPAWRLCASSGILISKHAQLVILLFSQERGCPVMHATLVCSLNHPI